MAYPNYYNNPYFYNQQQMQFQPPVQQQQQQQIQPGFVSVQSEQEARSYPVAPGNSITFKNENAPYCYVKTMGFSQLDRPIFERYRLVKEEDLPQVQQNPVNNQNYVTKDEVEKIWLEINSIKSSLKEDTEIASE